MEKMNWMIKIEMKKEGCLAAQFIEFQMKSFLVFTKTLKVQFLLLELEVSVIVKQHMKKLSVEQI